jgi:TP901 family phage tail tape measure protein
MAVGKELFKLWGVIGMGGVEKTNQELKKIDRQARKVQREMDKMGRRAVATGKTLMKGITLPLAIATGAVIKFGADFNKAMTRSTAIMGDLSESMQKDMRKAAIDVSKVTSASAKEAAEAYFFLASAGLDAAQSVAALPKVAKFAQAGAFDLARATDLLTDAQSALGLSSKDTATSMRNMQRVSDVLVKANTLANATVEQFSESLTNKAGAALRLLGKDIEEGAAVLAVYADQGLKGAAAGEALNISMRDLQKAAILNKESFKKARVEVFDSAGEMKNMADIVGDLEGLLSGMSDEGKKATLMQLGFTEKSINATMALLGTSGAIREYEKGLRAAAGTTDEVAKKQLQNFWDQLGLLKDRLIAVGLTTGKFAELGTTVLIPALNKIVTAIESVGKWYNSLSEGGKKAVKGFILIAAAVAPVVFLVGKLILIGKMLIPVFVALKTATSLWGASLFTIKASVLSVTLVIAALIALGWYWVSQWDTLSLQLKAIWAKVETFFLQIVTDMAVGFNDMILSIMEGIEKLADKIPGLNVNLDKAKVSILRSSAQMLKALGAQKAYTNNINDQAVATEGLIDVIDKAVDTVKKKLGIDEKQIEVTKTQIDLTKDSTKAEKEKTEAVNTGAQERLDFEKGVQAQLDELKLSEMERLEVERDQKLALAEMLNADIYAVEELYELKIQALQDKIRDDQKKKDEENLKRRLRETSKIGNKINSILNTFSDNRLKRIDLEEQKKIDAINRTSMTEEEKEKAIAKIQADSEKERRKAERQRAIREKVAALFNIAVNTASAIVEALPNIPLSILVGALGIAEGIAVATTPLPFQEGGLVQGSPAGVPAVLGERDTTELVLPLERGIDLFIDGLLERLSEIELPTFAAPEPALAGVGIERPLIFQVGTLIADEGGIKQLERRLNTVRIAENQRKGFQ